MKGVATALQKTLCTAPDDDAVAHPGRLLNGFGRQRSHGLRVEEDGFIGNRHMFEGTAPESMLTDAMDPAIQPLVIGARESGIHFRGMRDGRDRSEERRVGKECRSRWSPYH